MRWAMCGAGVADASSGGVRSPAGAPQRWNGKMRLDTIGSGFRFVVGWICFLAGDVTPNIPRSKLWFQSSTTKVLE